MVFQIEKLPERLKQGVFALETYGFLKCGERGTSVQAVWADTICIEKTEREIIITYDTEPHFYMALIRSMVLEIGVHCMESKTKQLGLMLDCSRNAVPKPETVKRLICMLVAAGYNYLELYTEDTYELPDEPYFGYKRGRFSEKELREIVSFADIFGFEMVPCMQALAHLKNLANWFVYYDHMDIDDILLVNDERTYNLIRKSLRFWKDIFHSKRINIGTDEAFHLGRGKYVDRYGYQSKHEIYLQHLKKVFQICREEGLEPEFWADAFYETECSVKEVQEIFDGTQTPIYWEYSGLEKEPHANKMKKLKEYAGKVIYAGAVWKCHGYAPDNTYSEKVMDVAFEAAWENDVEDILMTAWGDNGSECSVFALIPAIWYAGGKLYPCQMNWNELIRCVTGYTHDEWKINDRLNYVMPKVSKQSNAAKYLLHNDFIIGLLDYNIPDHAGEVYRELYPCLQYLARRNTPYAYIFKTYATLCKVLIQKATFSRRLYQAYQENNRGAIIEMIDELADIKKDLQKFYNRFRELWMTENKGFGFEVMDVRIGGLIARIDTVSIMLRDYLSGRIEKIHELEEERLEYFCGRLQGDEAYSPIHGVWATAYTVNHI